MHQEKLQKLQYVKQDQLDKIVAECGVSANDLRDRNPRCGSISSCAIFNIRVYEKDKIPKAVKSIELAYACFMTQKEKSDVLRKIIE